MGKKGDALRAQKSQKVIVHWTREQLEANNRAVVEDFKRRYNEKLHSLAKAEKERVDEYLETEWKAREELFKDNGYSILPLTMAISIEVLMDEFDWRPLPPENRKIHPRSRLARFVLGCEERLNAITGDETKDIRTYARAVWERSGVKLERYDDDEEHTD